MTETRTCAYCGKEFQAKIRSGPPPKYCSQAHRQRAHVQRRKTGEPVLIRELEAKVRRLEYDNSRLREALAAADAYALKLDQELHPRAPVRVHRYDIDQTPVPEPPEPPARWGRGRRGAS